MTNNNYLIIQNYRGTQYLPPDQGHLTNYSYSHITQSHHKVTSHSHITQAHPTVTSHSLITQSHHTVTSHSHITQSHHTVSSQSHHTVTSQSHHSHITVTSHSHITQSHHTVTSRITRSYTFSYAKCSTRSLVGSVLCFQHMHLAPLIAVRHFEAANVLKINQFLRLWSSLFTWIVAIVALIILNNVFSSSSRLIHGAGKVSFKQNLQ